MEEEKSLIYERSTIEFVTVALEFCTLVETAREKTLFDFLDKTTKMLPLLYLKAALLPTIDREIDEEPEWLVTEDMYESVREQIARLLGERDSYLETFHPDMPYSDTPIAAFISENLADVYQDIGNFVSLFRQGFEEVMEVAVIICKEHFEEYWGQTLLNALKALHAARYDEAVDSEPKEEEL